MTISLSLEELVNVLRVCWGADTSFTPEEWSVNNPARGQCLVSSLIIQDYYGGDLKRYQVKGKGLEEIHYCNVLYNGALIVDTTASQYNVPVSLSTSTIELYGYATAREKYLSNEQIKAQYELLKERVRRAQSQLS